MTTAAAAIHRNVPGNEDRDDREYRGRAHQATSTHTHTRTHIHTYTHTHLIYTHHSSFAAERARVSTHSTKAVEENEVEKERKETLGKNIIC